MRLPSGRRHVFSGQPVKKCAISLQAFNDLMREGGGGDEGGGADEEELDKRLIMVDVSRVVASVDVSLL